MRRDEGSVPFCVDPTRDCSPCLSIQACDYNIEGGSVLHLVLALRGGH